MFDKPEEIMMAVLFAAWVALTYFVAARLGVSGKYVLLVTGLTAGWAVLGFAVWKAGYAGALWPVFIGLLAACWWPWLDGLAVRGAAGDALIVAAPWYASWPFKLLTALSLTVAGYVHKWRQKQKPNFK